MQISDETFKEITDEIRDIINWIKVFEEEYNLPAEVVEKLRTKLEEMASKLGLSAIQ